MDTPEYGTMDRDAIWAEAVDVLTTHFTAKGYDVHYNSGEQALHIIDREPGNPLGRGSGSRLTQIAHTTWLDLLSARDAIPGRKG